jgi:hypothetical protein
VPVFLVGLLPEAGEVQLPLQQQNSEDVAAQQQQQNGSVKGASALMVEPQIVLPVQQDTECKCKTILVNAVHMLRHIILNYCKLKKETPWPQSASELYRPSDRRLSAKLVPTFFEDRGCYLVNVTNPYGRILGFLDRSREYFF